MCLLPSANEIAGRQCFQACLAVILSWAGRGVSNVTITKNALALNV